MTGTAKHPTGLPSVRAAPARRVCFVLPGEDAPPLLWPNAWSRMLADLRGTGVRVTVAVLPAQGRYPAFAELMRVTGARPEEITRVPHPSVASSKGVFAAAETAAYQLWMWLREQHFDIVHLAPTGGSGLFCLNAKRQGLAFADTVFCQRAHPTAIMRRTGALQPVDRLALLPEDHLERRCLEHADLTVAPNRSLLDALADFGVRLATHRARVQPDPPNCAPFARGAGAAETVLVPGPLGHDGGLPAICAALTRLAERASACPRHVVFAGPRSAGFDADGFLADKACSWPFTWEIRPNPEPEDVLAYLRATAVLPIFAAPGPGVPTWLPEALALRCPVLVRGDSGGVEALRPEDRATCAYDARPGPFAEAVATALSDRPAPARPADGGTAAARWRDWHIAPSGPALAPVLPRTGTTDTPRVTVCVMHHERPRMVRQALESVRTQNYPDVEIVLLDDGSRSPGARAELDALERTAADAGWRVVRQENSYLGAARNTAARHASGRYLYFLDDDNLLKPDGLARFVAVAERTGADIVTAFSDIFEGDGPPGADAPLARHTFVGDDLATGLFANCFGDSNALVRRSAFEALGGNSEDYGVGKDDQEFFARALLAGYRLELVPEALYWARRSAVRMRHKHVAEHAGDLRVSRPYRAAMPAELGNVALLAQGQRLAATQAAVAGSGDGAAAMRDTLTVASQHLADAPRLQGVAGRAYNAQKAAFQALIAFEVRLVRLMSGLVRRLARGARTN